MNNKTYIFIVCNICNIGGGQQYLSNKIGRLLRENFKIYVFSAIKGNVILNNLITYKDCIFPPLMYSPFIFSQKDIKSIIRKVCNQINKSDNSSVYIESNGIAQSEWGEILAKELHGIHICFDLQENNLYNKSQYNFICFKANRQEFFTISKDTTNVIFQNKDLGYQAWIKAECTNTYNELDSYDLNSIPKSDYIIGTIGRLDKPYLLPAINSFLLFADKYSNYSFTLILVGGGDESICKKIHTVISLHPNVKLFITGFLFPIPINLIKSVDCFFSTAGSALVSMGNNVPTISVDSISGTPIGILNYTTNDFLYCRGQSIHTMLEYLEMILFEHYCDNHRKLGLNIGNVDYDSEFKRQISFFKNNNPRDYYNTKEIKPHSKKEILYFIFAHLLGASIFIKLQRFSYKYKHIFYH